MRGDFIKDPENRLMTKIENKRCKLYQAYNSDVSFDRLITISQELDQLLNQLESIHRKNIQNKKFDKL